MTSSLVSRTRIAVRRAFPAAALLLTQCVTSYEVLEGGGGSGGMAGNAGSGGAASDMGGNGGSGGITSTGGSGEWTQATCYAAISHGVTGDPCNGTFDCESELLECCRWTATCTAGALALSKRCELCTCRVDSDCANASWCDDGNCRDCVETPQCLPPFRFAQRNGCAYCVPPDDCQSDADCPSNKPHCYAGQTCVPGCLSENDLLCCFGNRCAPSGCGATTGLDCSLVGCPDGSYCDIKDVNQACLCSQGRWLCTADSPNVCRPL